ncbi:tetratricopeptide repeat protein [Leptospira meyeri]|uniref:tetratricopeptide repeat protein n=1 Tax=Leptospira meyeri TaxID=29508 RepID=UPI001FAE9DDB|nr:hypothetical protein [Leptospira meyeri]
MNLNCIKTYSWHMLLLLFSMNLLSFCKENNPNNITNSDELLRYAIGYAEIDEFEKALVFATRAYDLEPKNEKVLFELSKIYSTLSGKLLRQFDCVNAKKYAKKAIALFKENDSAYNTLSNCAIGEKQFEDCIKYAKEEIRLGILYDNRSGSPYHQLGICNRELRRYNDSILNFQIALDKGSYSSVNFSYLDVRFSFGRIYFIKGKRKESKKYLEDFLASLKTVDDQELTRKFIVAEREAIKMLQILESGKPIGFPVGKEPAFNEDITSRFL